MTEGDYSTSQTGSEGGGGGGGGGGHLSRGWADLRIEEYHYYI